ncbi:uncharacterized protein LOC133316895 [Gastrolobium bilobum]|uniref:uncharacterized protein LOC133316895 n=1 Tax=Gastrolobium bilobum TaxID=150636 RepID=UPI002AB0683B|nr:uncharacterized protein LOC133316895 [Gastrolobium bilobum]
MGKKLDALLGRNFKAEKFKPTVNLAISRLAVLKNQRQSRFKQARSDVLQLLQLGHHQRALLRAEHVIKEQNMLDVYGEIEGYCNLLIERVHLIAQERECPEELKEAASGLLYTASRCGDFPEIQEIRAILTSRFGREFAARAIELRNNCGVHPQIIQKLSPRMPSLESRMKVLKDIASENSISLQLEEVSSVTDEEQVNLKRQNQHKPEIREEENLHILPNRGKDGELIDSFEARKKYKDVADAAQAAFESAAQAAAAARAAIELSRSESHDPDDHNSSIPRPRKVFDGHDSVIAMSQLEDKEILTEKEVNKNVAELEKPKDIFISNSPDEILKGDTVSMDVEIEADPFYESGNETNDQQKNIQSSEQIPLKYHTGIEINEVSESKMLSAPRVDLDKRPFSVRTRR